MSPIEAIQSNQNQAASKPENSIDAESFLKLFLNELKTQDPLHPVDNKEFMQQMATFSTLSQTSAIAHYSAQNTAYQLLGKKIYLKGDSEAKMYTVSAVNSNNQLILHSDQSQISKLVNLDEVDQVTGN